MKTDGGCACANSARVATEAGIDRGEQTRVGIGLNLDDVRVGRQGHHAIRSGPAFGRA